MRRVPTTARVVLLCLTLSALAAGGRAEEDNKPEDGFTSLFNGKDLTGWQYKGSKENLTGKTETSDSRIGVENGVLVMRAKDDKGKGGIKAIYTVKDFPKSFHLKVDFRASLKADSGVYIRGPQLQVRDFIRRNEQRHLKRFKDDDWNTLDIVVRNNGVVTLVDKRPLKDSDLFTLTSKDGKTTATLNGKDIDPKNVQIHRGPLAECSCNGEWFETMTNLSPKGGIGLQAETGKFEFRRVRIKELE